MKFDKIKEIGPTKLIILLVAGILLLVLSCGDLAGRGKAADEEKDSSTVSSLKKTDTETGDSYRESMERQVVELLSKVEGVGKTEVMITLSAGKEKVTLKDNETAEGKSEEQTVLVEDSERNSSPYVLQEKEPVPEGILVVCEGGGDPAVSREIISAIQVLFHVEAHKIKVMKMEP